MILGQAIACICAVLLTESEHMPNMQELNAQLEAHSYTQHTHTHTTLGA